MPNKYSAAVKRRAIQLARSCKSAANVIDALLKEFKHDEVPTNERTIRRWLKEKNIHYLRNINDHFAQLNKIANMLLDGGVDEVIVILSEADGPDRKYTLPITTCGILELNHNELVGQIEGNIDNVCRHYSTWHMWDCFAAHLEAEYPESKDFYNFLYTQTSTLINVLRTMAERKTFKGTCPICKYW